MRDTPEDNANAGLRAFLERDQYVKLLGIKFAHIEPGRASATMVVREDMVNAHGTCHGGAIFSLADAAFAAISNFKGWPAVAQFCSVAYLRPAKIGDELKAVGQETAVAGQRGVYDINVMCGSELIAAFRGHARLIGERVEPAAS
jgi:acyl-CoA thioesterase